MAQGVIDVFKAIQIQEEDPDFSVKPWGERNRLRDTVI
jgi:hypothetical protein